MVIILNIDQTNYLDDPIVKSFRQSGITRIDHLFLLDFDAINQLQYFEYGVQQDLPIPTKAILKILISFCHNASQMANGTIDLTRISMDQFNDYCIGAYDSSIKELIPWNVLKPQAIAQQMSELANCKKSICPSFNAFPEFRDEVFWVRTKENFESMFKALSLQHLIDPTYVPSNDELHKLQSQWVYKMFEDRMKAPIVKTIIVTNRKNKDIFHIWKELHNALDNSMTTELRLFQLSQFLTGMKLKKINWKSGQQNFIIHFAKTACTYNEINDTDHFLDN